MVNSKNGLNDEETRVKSRKNIKNHKKKNQK